MKLKTTLMTSILATTPFVAHLAQAEIYVIPRISIEQQSYTTDYLESDYIAPAIGLSLFSTDGIFLDVEGLSYHDGQDGSADTFVTESVVTKREELALTAGYRFDSGVILFGGLKKANTQGLDTDSDEWTFDTEGPFAGVSGSIKITDRVQVGLSGALAAMTGSVKLETFGDNASTESFDGNSIGLSTSAALNVSIHKGLIGSVGVKYQSYDYGDQIATEEVSSLFAKLAYRF
jgi:hypothetical protein